MAAVGAAAGADGRSCRRPSGAVAGLLENVSTNNQYLTDLGRRGGYQAVDSDGIHPYQSQQYKLKIQGAEWSLTA